jgi:hypothetical protein
MHDTSHHRWHGERSASYGRTLPPQAVRFTRSHTLGRHYMYALSLVPQNNVTYWAHTDRRPASGA